MASRLSPRESIVCDLKSEELDVNTKPMPCGWDTPLFVFA